MSGSTTDPGAIADDGSRGLEDDETLQRLIGILRSEGAAQLAHAGGRTLLDHLLGAYEIVRRWNQPPWIQHATLIHSVYGTDAYQHRLLPLARRGELIEIAGERAERLAYLFCVTPREPLFAGTHLWARDLRSSAPQAGREGVAATRAELDELILIHMANLAEQARAPDGSPGLWLVALRELAELVIDSDAVALPLFVAALAAFSEDDESLARRTYKAGTPRAADSEATANRMALTAALCPVAPEPCIWLAQASHGKGDRQAARWWARCGRRRLVALGTAWDKRRTYDQWLELAERLEHPVPAPPAPPPDLAVGTTRFHRYVETFAHADGPALRGLYPDLESQPWFDAAEFPLTRYLESHYEAIRDEILGLEPSRFQRESERIERSGDWDVAFLYERGRRREEVCDACPVIARGIESFPAMRTVAGLIYASRMRARTHIRAHRGPTNLRVRCHLGITVPEGDCAIRVGDETRRWQAGSCIVFDDRFEHEAWNRTEEDRIVLIVDLWHPGLSDTEVRLLEGLHRYVYAYARQLNRYWSANAAAARIASG